MPFGAATLLEKPEDRTAMRKVARSVSHQRSSLRHSMSFRRSPYRKDGASGARRNQGIAISALRPICADHRMRVVLKIVRAPITTVQMPMISLRRFLSIFLTISAATGVDSPTPMASISASIQSICFPASM